MVIGCFLSRMFTAIMCIVIRFDADFRLFTDFRRDVGLACLVCRLRDAILADAPIMVRNFRTCFLNGSLRRNRLVIAPNLLCDFPIAAARKFFECNRDGMANIRAGQPDAVRAICSQPEPYRIRPRTLSHLRLYVAKLQSRSSSYAVKSISEPVVTSICEHNDRRKLLALGHRIGIIGNRILIHCMANLSSRRRVYVSKFDCVHCAARDAHGYFSTRTRSRRLSKSGHNSRTSRRRVFASRRAVALLGLPAPVSRIESRQRSTCPRRQSSKPLQPAASRAACSGVFPERVFVFIFLCPL